MRTTSNEQRANLLARTAKEVRSYRVLMKLLSLALASTVLLVGILYTVATLYKKSGSFTISIDKYDMTEYGLTLSEKRDFSYKNSTLNAKIAERMTNIAGEDIPDTVDSIDGPHNGANHIAYTFYLSNAGETVLNYEYEVVLSNVTNGLDEALRVRLYVDGVPKTFAKTRSDGGGPEVNTTEFHNASVVTSARKEEFKPGEVTKFTVVVWIEGNDPDCLDTIINGQLKLDMNISVVH